MTHRLIQSWVPIAALGEENMREHRSMCALSSALKSEIAESEREDFDIDSAIEAGNPLFPKISC